MTIYTNTPRHVFELVEAIAATSSKKEKEALVKAGMGLPLFAKVVRYAYDQFKVFGIGKEAVPKKTPGIAAGGNTLAEAQPWAVLDDMADGACSGDLARARVQQMVDFLDDPSSELFRRILMKDMRAGFTEGTVNRVAPGTFPEFPYMRCTLPDKSNMEKWDWSVGIITQEKADGMFVNANVRDDGFVWVTTRQGTPIPLDNLPSIAAGLAKLPRGHQYHGEFTIWEHMANLPGAPKADEWRLLPRQDGNGDINSVAQGGTLAPNQQIRLQLWDMIPLTAVKPKGKFEIAYKQRLIALVKGAQAATGTGVSIIPTKICKTKGEAFAYYKELLKKGREGVICKHPDSAWLDTGTGNKDVVKLKLEVDVDLLVEEILPGDIGSKNEGKPGRLLCRTRCGLLKVKVAVKNEKMRKQLQDDPDSWLQKIAVVRANSIMLPSDSNEDHSLFLPRLAIDAPRADKTEADSLEQVQDQFRNAVEAA